MAAPTSSAIEGAQLSLWWGLPFAGLLLSIAIAPLVAPKLWHAHYGKVSAAWALALPCRLRRASGHRRALHQVVHALLLEYLPFIAILFALFTIAGGICLRGTLARHARAATRPCSRWAPRSPA